MNYYIDSIRRIFSFELGVSSLVTRFLHATAVALLAFSSAGASAEPRFKTVVDNWSSSTHFRGPVLTLSMFDKGTPQLLLSQGNLRIGGVLLMHEGKPLDGILKKVDARTLAYRFEEKPGIELTQTLAENGVIHCTLSASGGAVLEPVVLSLLSAPFSGSALKIDGETRVIEPGKAGSSAEKVAAGNIRELVFFADHPERSFTITLPDSGTAQVGCFPSPYGLVIKFIPAAGKTEYSLTLLPGPVSLQ